MKEIIIGANEKNKRLDGFLKSYLKNASSGFIYKMLRKKNITLNGKKSDGTDKLCEGDIVRIFFTDETLSKFRGESGSGTDISSFTKAFNEIGNLQIIYEDDNIVLVNKPAGVLSQKAKDGDISLNEWLIGYLLSKADVTAKSLETYKPSICNRLDVNTSGIVLCGRSQRGLDRLNNAIKEHRIRKFYRALLFGRIDNDLHLTAYISQSDKDNKVSISDRYPGKNDGYRECITDIRVIEATDDITYAEIQLVTGRKHQIRAHTAHIGHPVIGDIKYGDKKSRVISAKRQMLHASRVELPDDILDGMTICSAIPQDIKELLLRYGFKETS